MEQGTKEWLEWRRKGGIGASEIGAVIGVNPYTTPYNIWLEKTGRSPGQASNFAMERGTSLEPKARALYEFLYLETMTPKLAIHPKYPFIRVSLDGINDSGTKILEIKSPSDKTHSLILAGEVPPYYYAQVQYQLLATGAELAHFFSFREESINTYALVEIKPDVSYQAMLVVKANEFWRYVQDDVPPPLLDEDIKLVECSKGELTATRLRALKVEQTLDKNNKEIKKEIDRLKREFLEIAGHNKATCNGVTVTTSKTGTVTLRIK